MSEPLTAPAYLYIGNRAQAEAWARQVLRLDEKSIRDRVFATSQGEEAFRGLSIPMTVVAVALVERGAKYPDDLRPDERAVVEAMNLHNALLKTA